MISSTAFSVSDTTTENLTTILMDDKAQGVEASFETIGEIVNLLLSFTNAETVASALYEMADGVVTYGSTKEIRIIN